MQGSAPVTHDHGEIDHGVDNQCDGAIPYDGTDGKGYGRPGNGPQGQQE